jgi:chemotaxis protein methyltransferase CheR
MKDSLCVEFLQWALPQLRMRWPGFRKVRKQVCKRVDRRLRELGLADVQAYREYLTAQPAEWPVLDAFCRISISRLYRDRGVYDYLRDVVLPGLAAAALAGGQQALRCWSAGCASGEEVYTLRIVWQLAVQPKFPDVGLQLVATDSDEEMLVRARRGCYRTSSLKDFPKAWLPLAFAESEGEYCVKSEFRDRIDFLLQDIRQEMPDGPFSLVLCRHVVFTYFDEALQKEVLGRILDRLLPGGFLVAGKQEPLPELPADLEECRPRMGIYQKRVCGDPTRAQCQP